MARRVVVSPFSESKERCRITSFKFACWVVGHRRSMTNVPDSKFESIPGDGFEKLDISPRSFGFGTL